MISLFDWFELVGGFQPFETPWPAAPPPAAWSTSAADDAWILEAGRVAQLAVLLELDARFALILDDIREKEL